MESNTDNAKRDLKDRHKANDAYIAMAKITIEKANSAIDTLERENREIVFQIREIALYQLGVR